MLSVREALALQELGKKSARIERTMARRASESDLRVDVEKMLADMIDSGIRSRCSGGFGDSALTFVVGKDECGDDIEFFNIDGFVAYDLDMTSNLNQPFPCLQQARKFSSIARSLNNMSSPRASTTEMIFGIVLSIISEYAKAGYTVRVTDPNAGVPACAWWERNVLIQWERKSDDDGDTPKEQQSSNVDESGTSTLPAVTAFEITEEEEKQLPFPVIRTSKRYLDQNDDSFALRGYRGGAFSTVYDDDVPF